MRDRYLGWSEEALQRNVQLLAYNTRFLILAWAEAPHLASHILGRMAKIVPADWQRLYAHPIYWLETFVAMPANEASGVNATSMSRVPQKSVLSMTAKSR